MQRIPACGFTLLELVFVIAIACILAAIAVPTYFSFIEKAKVTRAISEISVIEREIAEWQINNGSLPLSLEEIGRGDFLDPWGNRYQYLNFTTINGEETGEKRNDNNMDPINDYFDLYSMGKDGKSQPSLTEKTSKDDIIRARNGRYKGIASEFS